MNRTSIRQWKGKSMYNQLEFGRRATKACIRRKITLVALILIPEVFLKTFLMAFISARSPARVEVACAFM
jgi:hypothetical protein